MSKKKSNAFTDSDIVIREQVAPEFPAEVPTVSAEESHISTNPTVEGYVFETKDIPKRSGKKGTLNYPIDQLIAGSPVSFLVPATADKVKKVTASIRTYAYRNDFTVTLRAEDGGVRVWRTAPKE